MGSIEAAWTSINIISEGFLKLYMYEIILESTIQIAKAKNTDTRMQSLWRNPQRSP